MSVQNILTDFPKLLADPWWERSEETNNYNCFAFALHDEQDWYSPLPISGYYWPHDVVAREATLEKFIEMYAYEGGFSLCESGEPEDGYEKIALYAISNRIVSHAARLLPNGNWASKLGNMEDIEHAFLSSLEDTGHDYGSVVKFLKRPSRAHSLAGVRANLLGLLRGRSVQHPP